MKILHTADIHLREYEDSRWKTLESLIELGRKEKVSILVISGDLFDRGVDAEKLRPKIRALFSKNGFTVVVIPGNHDINSFKPGLYFGEEAVILNDWQKPFEVEQLRIIGLPFQPIGREDIIARLTSLKEVCTSNKMNVLLCHGELLDSFFSRMDFGEEGTERYMPFWLSDFEGVNLDYILAGHFHTSFEVRLLENGGFFVYPGSPVSITRRETGQRKVNLFELGKEPREFMVDSPHYEELCVKFDPFRKESVLVELGALLDGLHPQAHALLTLQGFVDGKTLKLSEVELQKKVNDLVGERGDVLHFECRDIQEVMEDDLLRDFQEKLEESGMKEERKRELMEMTIRALIETQG